MRPRLLLLGFATGMVGLVLLVRAATDPARTGAATSTVPAPAPTTAEPTTDPDQNEQLHDEDLPHGDHADAIAPPPVPPAVEELSRSPLVQALPHSTTHYRIDGRIEADGELQLIITLNAVLNHSSQISRYTEELRQYKAEATEFIRRKAADPDALRIVYIPPEAAQL